MVDSVKLFPLLAGFFGRCKCCSYNSVAALRQVLSALSSVESRETLDHLSWATPTYNTQAIYRAETNKTAEKCQTEQRRVTNRSCCYPSLTTDM